MWPVVYLLQNLNLLKILSSGVIFYYIIIFTVIQFALVVLNTIGTLKFNKRWVLCLGNQKVKYNWHIPQEISKTDRK